MGSLPGIDLVPRLSPDAFGVALLTPAAAFRGSLRNPGCMPGSRIRGFPCSCRCGALQQCHFCCHGEPDLVDMLLGLVRSYFGPRLVPSCTRSMGAGISPRPARPCLVRAWPGARAAGVTREEAEGAHRAPSTAGVPVLLLTPLTTPGVCS